MYNRPTGSIYHFYTRYILPSRGFIFPTTLYKNQNHPLKQRKTLKWEYFRSWLIYIPTRKGNGKKNKRWTSNTNTKKTCASWSCLKQKSKTVLFVTSHSLPKQKDHTWLRASASCRVGPQQEVQKIVNGEVLRMSTWLLRLLNANFSMWWLNQPI